MKPPFPMFLRASALLLGWMVLCGAVNGQVTTILHNFGDGTTLPANLAAANDGTTPGVPLLQGGDGNFYGTTSGGGAFGFGTAFMMTPYGVTTILHSFGDPAVTNDGHQPSGALIEVGNGVFYGTTATGGSQDEGVIYSMTSSGTITILHHFGDGTALNPDGSAAANDGISPTGGLVLGRDGKFYGVTSSGGTGTTGTAFVMTNAGVVTILHHFGDGTITNDGTNPVSSLVQGSGSDTSFYGLTSGGGANAVTTGPGTFFKITPLGAVAILHSFGGSAVTTTGAGVTDGSSPSAGLILGADGNFYGTTIDGGGDGNGTGDGAVFKVTPQGSVTILHSFGGTGDGTFPAGGVAQGADGSFYGTTSSGGTGASGTVFRVTGQGAETILHTFGDGSSINPDDSAATDGGFPSAGISLGADGNFYGVTTGGGTGPALSVSGPAGTIFKIAITTPSLVAPQQIAGYLGAVTSLQVNASNQPTRYGALNLPAGLSINPETGNISGIPTAQGVGTFVVTFTNGAGTNFAVLSYDISGYVYLEGSPLPSGLTLTPTPVTNGLAPNDWQISLTPLELQQLGLSFDAATGILSGTPTVASKVTFTVTAYYKDPGTGNLTVRASQSYTILFPQTFGQWETSNQMANSPNTVFRHDGVADFLKYFFDIDPKVSMTVNDFDSMPNASVKTVGGVSYLTLTYRQSQLTSGVTVGLQTSPDLVTWTPASADFTAETGIDPATGDPIIQTGVKATPGLQFIRLNLSAP